MPEMQPLFRASGFGYEAPEVYSYQVLGLRKQVTPYMKRGTIAEDIVRHGLDSVETKWIRVPDTLEDTGFKRWAEFWKDKGMTGKEDNIIKEDVWASAVKAAECLTTAFRNLGLEPKTCGYQQTGILELRNPGTQITAPLLGKRTDAISYTCDFTFDHMAVDTKVLTNPLHTVHTGQPGLYDWQLSVQQHGTKKDAIILAAIEMEGGMFVPQLYRPKIQTMDAIRNRAVEMALALTSCHALMRA